MKKILFAILILIGSVSAARAESPLIAQADSAYNADNFRQAADIYLNVIQHEGASAKLYYNLGNYMGNNYESAVIVAKNAIKNYPYSKYKEELEMLVLKSRYQEASQSVPEKKSERFRDVIDEYYSFINNYPDGPNRKEADNILRIAQKHVQD